MSTRLPGCLIFDLDGTILHSLPGIEYSVREAFACLQLPHRDVDLRGRIGPPISTILSIVGNIRDSEELDSLVQAFRSSYDNEGWRKTELFPHARNVLETLSQAGYRLFVVSNKPKHISMRILDHLGIGQLFEAIVTRDSRSPSYSGKAEMLRALAIDHQFDLHQALVVGDTMEDAKASAESGAPFAFMAHGYGELDCGASVPVFLKLDGFAQFLPLIAKELVHD